MHEVDVYPPAIESLKAFLEGLAHAVMVRRLQLGLDDEVRAWDPGLLLNPSTPWECRAKRGVGIERGQLTLMALPTISSLL